MVTVIPLRNGVVIYDTVQLWDEGKLIGNWARGLSNSLTRNISDAAPRSQDRRAHRSSNAPITTLRDSVKTRSYDRPTPESRTFEVSMHFYGAYVNGGTAGSVGWQGVPDNGGAYRMAGKRTDKDNRQWTMFMSGQPPQFFVDQGFAKTAIKYPSVAGYSSI